MPAPRKYPDEMRERAIRLVLDIAGEAGSVAAACRRIGEELGINSDTLRGWIKRAQIDSGIRPTVASPSFGHDIAEAGCRAGPPIPKLVRALGQRTSGAPDVVITRIRSDATVSALISCTISRPVTQIMRHDPGVRLGEDPEAVHRSRVATRRLRSDLRSFDSLFDPQPVSELRDGLRQLGTKAGEARDIDVLSGRLRAKAGQLPQQDAAGVNELPARLDALRSPACDQLLDSLGSAARQPPVATEPAGLADPPVAPVAQA